MTAPTDKRTVAAVDLTHLTGEDLQNLSVARHIELVKCKPQQFGLEKWTRLFKIPDHWMRKIYRNQAWIDTEKRPSPEFTGMEQLSEYQKVILHDWLRHKSPFSSHDTNVKTRTAVIDLDDLKQDLSDLSDAELVDFCDIPYRGLCSDVDQTIKKSKQGLAYESRNSRKKIAMVSGHQYKSEEEIARIAIDKMNHLSPEDEKKFKALIEDDEYMNLLKDNVEKYLNFCGVLQTRPSQ